jgi:hypothetical protein
LAAFVSGSASAQDALMGARVVRHGAELPALQAVLQLALYGESGAERAASEQALRAFCAGNADGQSMLASTVMPVSADGGAGTKKWARTARGLLRLEGAFFWGVASLAHSWQGCTEVPVRTICLSELPACGHPHSLAGSQLPATRGLSV